MNETLGFKFYSILKNEDAEPFNNEALLAIADGLGGAGSTVHTPSSKRQFSKKPLKADVLGSMLPCYNEQTDVFLKDYMDIWLQPIVKGEPITSALWASRIVIARFVYYLLNNPAYKKQLNDANTLKKIAEFIAEGLDETASQFKLKLGKYINQKLLPSTLAAMLYAVEKEEVIVDVLWAGDSRCYALLPEGLKQLTIDDEDNTGALSNLFYAQDKHSNTPHKLGKLRHKQFRFKQPCILIAASDGIFDPYFPKDNLGVEVTLLNSMFECQSSKELSESLKAHYDKIRSDDATMVFEPFGFATYQDMQNTFRPRFEEVTKIGKNYNQMRTALEVIDSQESANDVINKIFSRTTDKLQTIAVLLTETYIDKKQDFVLNALGTASFEQSIVRLKDEFEHNKKTQQENLLDNIEQYIRENYVEVITQVFAEYKPTSILEVIHTQIGKLKTLAINLASISKEFDNICEDHRKTIAEGDKIIVDIKERRRKIYSQIEEQGYEVNAATDKLHQEDEVLRKIQKRYNSEISSLAIVRHEGNSKSYAQIIDENIRKQNKFAELISKVRKQKEEVVLQYQAAVKGFVGFGKIILIDAEQIFQPKFITHLDMDKNKQEFSLDSATTHLIANDLYKDLVKDAKKVNAINQALAQNHSSTSVIDSCYNSTRLSNFRQYYQLMATSTKQVEQFKKELEEFMSEYESVKDYEL